MSFIRTKCFLAFWLRERWPTNGPACGGRALSVSQMCPIYIGATPSVRRERSPRIMVWQRLASLCMPVHASDPPGECGQDWRVPWSAPLAFLGNSYTYSQKERERERLGEPGTEKEREAKNYNNVTQLCNINTHSEHDAQTMLRASSRVRNTITKRNLCLKRSIAHAALAASRASKNSRLLVGTTVWKT